MQFVFLKTIDTIFSSHCMSAGVAQALILSIKALQTPLFHMHKVVSAQISEVLGSRHGWSIFVCDSGNIPCLPAFSSLLWGLLTLSLLPWQLQTLNSLQVYLFTIFRKYLLQSHWLQTVLASFSVYQLSSCLRDSCSEKKLREWITPWRCYSSVSGQKDGDECVFHVHMLACGWMYKPCWHLQWGVSPLTSHKQAVMVLL